jgi:hypothetical protein
MIFCTQCGTQLPENSKFCSSCGAKVDGAVASEGAVQWPDLSQFGAHPITLGKFLESSDVKRLSKHAIRGIEKNLPGALEEKVSAIPLRGEDADGDLAADLDSYLNSKKRDKYLKTPLVVFPSYYPDGLLGQFRLANKAKGISQQQDQNGSTWGHTDWLFLLENRIVLVNDFADNFTWKDASYYKSFTYDEVSQAAFSQDHMAESGFMNAINYFFTTFQFRLQNGAEYARYLLLGQSEDERNNNAYKGLALYSFLAWKLRLDLNPNRLIALDGTSTDNTIKTSATFGIFREMGD